jgi:hypothetical protein
MSKKCKKCNKRIKSNYDFCPSCGTKIHSSNQKEWGLLGRDDFVKQEDSMSSIMNTLNSGGLGKMLNSAMKMLEKEMQKDMTTQNSNQKTKVKLMINGREINPQFIKKESKASNIKILPIEFAKETQEKFSKMKKIEPKTKLRRFGNQIHYELEIPEVQSIKDISILRLENGLEVKALSKKKAYQKIITINLPLSKYTLAEGILTLELEAGE